MTYTTKLSRVGNSTGLTIPREVLAAASLDRGDEVTLSVRGGKIEIGKSDDTYNRTMASGMRCMQRYRRALAGLAK